MPERYDSTRVVIHESYLWLFLSLYALWKRPTSRYVQFAILDLFQLAAVPSSNGGARTRPPNLVWRHPQGRDPQGRFMRTVLARIILEFLPANVSICRNYGLLVSSAMRMVVSTTDSMMGRSLSAAAVAAVIYESNQPLPFNIGLVAFVPLLVVSIRWAPSLHGVFTEGEWTLVVTGLTLVLCEFLSSIVTFSNEKIDLDVTLVATAGLLSTMIGCLLVRSAGHWVTNLVAMKMAVLVAIPVLTLEILLSSLAYPYPKSLFWLVWFLQETEEAMTSHLASSLPTWPRYYWLGYWIMFLVVVLPWTTPTNNVRTVLSRKFFHVVALFLFVPVTLASPSLMGLAYAVALALLLVLEGIRADVMVLQQFYEAYLDPNKDDSTKVVISHAALIAGCAIPFWISQCLPPRTMEESNVVLLSLWGVIVLGVGDAMGAIVGTLVGKIRWNNGTGRTVEGSAAMLSSMSLVCLAMAKDINSVSVWLPAVLFTTFLEATTSQIDNIILPLAGTAVLLVRSG